MSKSIERRNVIKLLGLVAAGLALGPTIRALGLDEDAQEIMNALQAEYGPKDQIDTGPLVSDSRGEYQYEADTFDYPQGGHETPIPVEVVPTLDTREFRIANFSLWDGTVDLASPNYPLATIVVPNDGYVIAGGATVFTPWVSEFNDNIKFSHSFIAGKREIYTYNPHTFLHSGYTQGRFLAAGNLEVALRTAEAQNMTIPQTIAASEVNFSGARVILLQAPDVKAFESVTSFSNVDRALNRFHEAGGNSVELAFDRLVRVPREELAMFRASLSPYHGDPNPLLARYASMGHGWGDWENADTTSRWHIQFCAGSAVEDLEAENQDFRINAARWVAGLRPVGGVASFDPFSV